MRVNLVHSNKYFSPRRKGISIAALAVVGLSFLAGCSYTKQQDISNPVVRKATWFSYLNGDDIRTACSAGEAEGRIRMVYNAKYYKETRSFDISPMRASDDFTMVSHIFGPIDVSAINVEANAPLGAFGGDQVTKTLSRQDYLRLTDALQQDGFGTQERDGLRLHSQNYYWVAIGCSQKHITLAAWTSAKDDLRSLHFPKVLSEVSGQTKPLPMPPAADAVKLPDPNYPENSKEAKNRNFYRTVRGNTLR